MGGKTEHKFISPLGGTKTKQGRGRSTLLDDAVAAVILNAIRAGAWRCVAARLAGVSPKSLQKWLKWGRKDPDSVYGRFRKQFLQAENEVEFQAGKSAFEGALKDPEIALKYLAVRKRTRWDSKKREAPAVVNNVSQQTTVTVAEAAPDDGQLGSLIDILGTLGFPTMGGVAQARAAGVAEEGADVSEGAVHPGPLEAPS